MLGLLKPAHRGHAGPLVNVTAANHFWHLLPRGDPVSAQQALSGALAELSTRNPLHLDDIRALLGIDQLSRSLADALSVEYVLGDAQPQESVAWQSAFELSRSFAGAFQHAFKYLRDEKSRRARTEYLSTVLLRLVQHRQVDFLLRPFVSETWLPDCWIELHAAYLHAESAGLLRQALVSRSNDQGRGDESSLEREYIHLLLVELLNVGQLSPYDAFWVNRQIPRWRTVLALQARAARAPVEAGEPRFVVDLDNAEGLVRPARSSTGNHRYLDLAPMLKLIGEEIARLRDPAGSLDDSALIRRGRQLKLLRKIHAICQPIPERVDRRGDRSAATSTVKAIVGLPHITRMLRHERRRRTSEASSPTPAAEGGRSSAENGIIPDAALDFRPDSKWGFLGASAEFGAPHQEWQVKDSSASGCRLRGKIAHPNRVLPGTLLAFHVGDNLSWTLAVVRRIRKRIGDRVDIGVEYVGRDPLGVTLVAETDTADLTYGNPNKTRKRCTALYLREGSEHPKMPFKTLILRPRYFKAGRSLILRSHDTNYTVRLKEPIEEQDGFVWLPYEVVDRQAGGAGILREVA